MLKKFIAKLSEKQNLTETEASEIIEIITGSEVPNSQVAALLVCLKMKGETTEEITGFAKKLREKSLKINRTDLEWIVDSCGTGGDGANLFNISTAAAILASAAGACVVKHSNFGFTSISGSSNVLEALGIKLPDSPEAAEFELKSKNIAFLHAPNFHRATGKVASVRKELGLRTVFNILGPLTNPAFPDGQVVGVADRSLCLKMAQVLKNTGCKRAIVACGINPNVDEISLCGKTLVSKLENGIIETFELHPSDFGMTEAKLSDLQGDTPDVNAKIIENIFAGVASKYQVNAVLINTGAILWTACIAKNIEHGIQIAKTCLESGKAEKKLNELCLRTV